jgi:hypothetical protein
MDRQFYAFYVQGSVHRESMPITVQQMPLYTVLLYFLQTALHVSDDTLFHHQEHIQIVITTTGTGRTVYDIVH